MKKIYVFAASLLFASSIYAGVASAALFDSGIPSGWSGVGNYGTSGANGVVTAPPSGASNYGWVSTNGGTSLGDADLNIGSETNGSVLHSSLFSANAGDELIFNFNFVTSDGAGYADYAWARLLDSSSNEVALLFTARTTPGGNSVPGFGMPTIEATMTPATVTIISGGPSWSPLGSSSGACYSGGCGYTGWIESTFEISTSANYMLEFGVVNWSDTAYDTGMAFDGITIGGTPIEETPPSVPEPASLLLLGAGLAGLGFARRKSS